jgi:glutathione S-transferase
MKLYYSPFACSLAAHIACREADLPVTLIRTELSTKHTQGGGDLFSLNPMGQVPTLVTDDGYVLTENVAVLSYLADRARGAKAEPESPFERYEQTRWLSFVSTEVHKKVLAMIFGADSPDAVKDHGRAVAKRALSHLAAHLDTRDTLLGDAFSTADAYLFWALTLMPHAGISLEPYPSLARYHARHLARPAVKAVLRFERDQHQEPFRA